MTDIPAKAGIHPHTPSFPRRRESTSIIRHSREGGNPQFPRTREFNENTIQTDQSPHSLTGRPQRHSREGRNPTPVIRHSREGGNPPPSSVIPAHAGIQRKHHPDRPVTSFPHRTTSTSFPRRRESTIPAHAGIHRKHHPDRPRPTSHLIPTQDDLNVIPTKTGIHPCHPSFPRRRESTIPAHAGIQRKHHPDRPVTSFPHRTTSTSFPRKRESTPVIRHSREGGNPQFPRTREFNENTIQTDQSPHSHTGRPQRHSRENGNSAPSSVIPAKTGIHPHHPSFPRRRESTIPAHAGIHRKHHPDRPRPTSHLIPTQDDLNVIPTKAGIHPRHPSFPRKRESTPIIRHSREGGNPQFPRTREFNENTIQTDQSPHSHTGRPQRHSHENGNPPLSSVIPAKAGIHNSRARGNSSTHSPTPETNIPSFPRRPVDSPAHRTNMPKSERFVYWCLLTSHTLTTHLLLKH